MSEARTGSVGASAAPSRIDAANGKSSQYQPIRAIIRIDNGMVMSQVDSNWFQFAVGALTILAVVGNSWLRKRGRAMKVET